MSFSEATCMIANCSNDFKEDPLLFIRMHCFLCTTCNLLPRRLLRSVLYLLRKERSVDIKFTHIYVWIPRNANTIASITSSRSQYITVSIMHGHVARILYLNWKRSDVAGCLSTAISWIYSSTMIFMRKNVDRRADLIKKKNENYETSLVEK